jgi:hypothetical protein
MAWLCLRTAVPAAEYHFDGQISRPVLENYLSRSITMLDLLTGHGSLADNVRMLQQTGAKFAGRTIYVWGHEAQLPARLSAARRAAPKCHAADPDMILQACVFEIVSEEVGELRVPEWVFEAFGEPAESRHFRYQSMLDPGGRGRDRWWRGASVPDISRAETKRWFFFLAASYIDVGCEAIHFGQAEIMDGNDPDHEHWWALLQLVRSTPQTTRDGDGSCAMPMCPAEDCGAGINCSSISTLSRYGSWKCPNGRRKAC